MLSYALTTLLHDDLHSDTMGKLFDRLQQPCPRCGAIDVPRRMIARFVDGDRERAYLMFVLTAGEFWLDPTVRRKKQYHFEALKR